ncbi:MAG: hypothetical protein DMG59_26795 [Acidobacteria bacterium]|nr:MAG: hypothetical protein DMG59_26795 [Acidobacteriota bacterium]
MVHIKPPFGEPQRVLKYLARYTHRVVISKPSTSHSRKRMRQF